MSVTCKSQPWFPWGLQVTPSSQVPPSLKCEFKPQKTPNFRSANYTLCTSSNVACMGGLEHSWSKKVMLGRSG